MKKLTIYILAITTIAISLFSCKETNKPIKLNYCQMLEDDQTLQGQERKEVFKNNFHAIIEFTKENGFPNYDFNSLPKDSCKTWALMVTLIHIAQTAPEFMFNSETLDLFSAEIEKGNLDPEDIYPAFKVSTGGGKIFCDSLKPYIDMTFVKWKMNQELKAYFKYENCQN